MPKYERFLRAAYQTPWAIREEKLAEIRGFLARVEAGENLTAEALRAQIGQPSERPRMRVGSVEVIPVQGVIAQKMNLFMEFSGGTSTEMLAQDIQRAVDDPKVSAILLDIDSPGGSVYGVAELGETILQARQKKRIVGMAHPEAASAAYWIAACCSEVVVQPSGQIGSIGVIMLLEDHTERLKKDGVRTTIIRAGRYKVEANPFEPLTEEARAHLEAQTQAYYDMFIRAVADGRKVDPRTVRSGFGQGRMLMATEAKAAGMVDRVATFDATLARLLMRGARQEGPAAQIETVRDLEDALRDGAGLSHARARHIASLAFKDKTEPPSGMGAAEPVTEPVTEPVQGADEQELREALRDYVGRSDK